MAACVALSGVIAGGVGERSEIKGRPRLTEPGEAIGQTAAPAYIPANAAARRPPIFLRDFQNFIIGKPKAPKENTVSGTRTVHFSTSPVAI